MTPRDRVLAAFDHREPDRVPVDMGGSVASIERPAYVNLKKYLGLLWRGEKVDGIGIMETLDDEILRMFNVDFRRVIMKPPKNWIEKRYADGIRENEWGVRFKQIGYYWEWIWYTPLGDIEDKDQIEDHTWPDLGALGRVEGLEKEARDLESAGWAVSTAPIFGGIFEIAWWLRGFNKFIVDLYTRPELASALMEKITDTYIGLYDQYLGAVGDHVQMVMFTDDLGAQTQMLVPPSLYRKYLKPCHKRLFDFIHSKTDARVFLHCCGSIDPVINDLIEIGVDVLNPVQPLAAGMESEVLKRNYGDRLTFHGGVDIQRALALGTIQEIDYEVRRRMKAFAPGGGYIFAPAHNIQPEIPAEKIVALYKAAEKYGCYPVT